MFFLLTFKLLNIYISVACPGNEPGGDKITASEASGKYFAMPRPLLLG